MHAGGWQDQAETTVTNESADLRCVGTSSAVTAYGVQRDTGRVCKGPVAP